MGGGGGGGESVTKVKFVTNFYSENVEYEVLKSCGKWYLCCADVKADLKQQQTSCILCNFL